MSRPRRKKNIGYEYGVTDQRGAARVLGCSERCVRMLCSRGILHYVGGLESLGGGLLCRWYRLSDLDKLRRYREINGSYPWGGIDE